MTLKPLDILEIDTFFPPDQQISFQSMAAQVQDKVLWNQKKFDLLGYERSPLFDPLEYGLYPEWRDTYCRRGYVCFYKIEDSRLYLDSLKIATKNGNYPPVNAVSPKISVNMKATYSHIHFRIPYTGAIRIGNGFRPEFCVYLGFQKPSAYTVVWDLEFKDGEVTGVKDISDEVKKIKGKYHEHFSQMDIIDRVSDAYNRDMNLR